MCQSLRKLYLQLTYGGDDLALDASLLSDFAKVTIYDEKQPASVETTTFGTVINYGGKPHVQLDGSDLLTPVTSTVYLKDGDRVTVLIKNHTALVSGNVTDVSVGGSRVKDEVQSQIGDTIAEFEIIIADKVSTLELEAERGRIKDLETDYLKVNATLEANEIVVGELVAKNVEITGTLDAAVALIDDLTTNMLTAEIADIKYATVENLEATNATIYNLEGTYGEFVELTTQNFEAINGYIQDLDTQKLSAVEADIRYANIDFANIGEAAVRKLFADTGLIKDLVVGDTTITGELVGVTIKGDLIEGNTIVAEKLVVRGSDGLFYKLNTDGMTVGAEQTDYNSLHGSIITAKSITATKISVDDLVAFDATIGGFVIGTDAIHSNVKNSVDNTTRGIYMDNDGQLNVGDSNNYLKYYRDTDGQYKLEISASQMKFKVADGRDIDDAIADADMAYAKSIKATTVNYVLSTSGTTTPTTGWQTTVPTLVNGRYLWTRTVTELHDGTKATAYSISRIAQDGNNGTNGIAGKDGVGIKSTSITYVGSTSGTTKPTSGWNTAVPTVASGSFLWTRTIWTYTDNTTETGYSVARMGVNGAKGDTGEKGSTGASATSYWITASNNIIGKSQTGVINPTTITFKGFSKTGTANSVAYSGRFIIQTSTNGTAYTTRYTSGANQNSYTYTIPADSLFVKCLFYMAGGTTVLLDEQTVPIVESAEGIEVGGENLLLNTSFNKDTLSKWNINGAVAGSIDSTNQFEGVNSLKLVFTGSGVPIGSYTRLFQYNTTGEGNTFMMTSSVYVKADKEVVVGLRNGGYEAKRTTIGTSWQKISQTEIGDKLLLWAESACTLWVAKPKTGRGTIATDWTPAPEDARTYKAWANSSDGTVDFTRVYPNENLIVKANITTGGHLTSTGGFGANGDWFYTDYIPVAGMTKLVTSGYTNLGIAPATVYYNGAKAFVKGINNNGQSLAKDITIDSGIEYIRFSGEIKDLPTLKLEQGTTPTVYTTNTADSLAGSVMQYIGFSPLDSNNPSEYEWIINPEYTQALSDEATGAALEEINDSLVDKVGSEEFEKLEQLAKQFAESYEQFVSDGGRYEEDLTALEGRLAQIIFDLGDRTLDLEFINTYMRAGDEGFLIGKEESQIKMLLTNDRLSFTDSGQEVAFFSGQSFYINRGAIVQSLQVGQHKLTNLGNGHTIFQYVG